MTSLTNKVVVGYVRTSSVNNPENSIPFQKKHIREFCEKKGYRLLQIFEDDSISGELSEERYGYQDMLSEISKSEIDAVLVTFFHRFSRDAFAYISKIDELKSNGVEVIAILENQSTNDMDSLQIAVSGAQSELENEQRKKVVREGKENLLEEGRYPYRTPYGYKKDESQRLIAHPREAKVVQQIFYMYYNGNSIQDIKKWLKDHQINISVTPYDILRNRIYTGYIYRFQSINGKQRKDKPQIKVSPVKHEEIIEEYVFKGVNRRIQKEEPKKTQHTFRLLKGLFYCPNCHRKMYIYRKNFFECGNRRNQKTLCERYNINDVTNRVISFLDNFGEDQTKDGLYKEIKNIRKQIKSLMSQVSCLGITLDKYRERRDLLDRQLQSLYEESNLGPTSSYKRFLNSGDWEGLREMLVKQKVRFSLDENEEVCFLNNELDYKIAD